ncbi:MAG: hypothetical protein ACOYU4_08260 [Thermodesulfobacteriota bacterium]
MGYDYKHERHHLPMGFGHVAKLLFRARDYSNACAALQESIILKGDLKVFVQWLIIKLIETATFGKMKSSGTRDLDQNG